ncbi:hypothetical protein FQV43_07210 [Corynebacterium sp. sy039]|nr:hypothetical protein FQV43_07210 [Corynebacterium sp. sy039]
MNAVLIAVLVMLILAAARIHVVLALFIGAIIGGVVSGIGLEATMVAFQEGLSGGAKIALSYALLGAFAMAVAHSGLPVLLAQKIMRRISPSQPNAHANTSATGTAHAKNQHSQHEPQVSVRAGGSNQVAYGCWHWQCR